MARPRGFQFGAARTTQAGRGVGGMRSLVISERCVVDPTRPCGACSAPGPGQCPYRYLLDADELAEILERAPAAPSAAPRRGRGRTDVG